MADRKQVLLPAFAGFFFALAMTADGGLQARAASRLERAPDPLVLADALTGADLDPDAMCVRDLRRLPGIGPARALAIARARFDLGLRGGPQAWERIHGIGLETVRAARAWLTAASAERLLRQGRGAYTSTGRRP